MAHQIVITTENIGETIKAIRMEKNVRQEDLCKQCGINPTTLRSIENNYGHSPSWEIVFSIFKALGKKVVLK